MGFMQFHTHGQPRKMIQTPDLVTIIYEANYGLRYIFTDGRTLPPQGDPQPWWYGYSVGRWEGDTLVVETNNLRGDGWLDVRGSPFTEQAKITERFRRVSFGKLEIDITIDDPMAYTKPFTVRVNQQISVDNEIIEFICNENQQFRKLIKSIDRRWFSNEGSSSRGSGTLISMSPSGPTTATNQAVLLARLRETIELLESIAADRTVLSGVPDEERRRLLQAVANVYSPDRVERRRMSKVVARERKAARVRSDQDVLHETGIRTLRRKPVFHTPNVFPTVSVADGFQPLDVHENAEQNVEPARVPNPESRVPDPDSPRAESRKPRAAASATCASRSTRPSTTSTINCAHRVRR